MSIIIPTENILRNSKDDNSPLHTMDSILYKPALNNIMSTPELTPVNSQENSWRAVDSLSPPLDNLPPLLDSSETLAAPLKSDHKPAHQRQISSTPSLTPSLTPSFTPSSIYSTNQHQQHASVSRYSKASFSLTHNPDAIKLYREMAHKTNDPAVQLAYAKYLLEIASLYDTNHRPFRPNLSLTLAKIRRESFSSNLTSDSHCSVDSHVTATAPSSEDDEEPVTKQKTKKMLEDEGVRWIKRLAKSRQGEAAYLLGLWYDRGMYDLRKSQTRALKFYEIASNQKIPEAIFAVGQHYERNREYMISFQLYEEAASLGLVEALYRIAMINLNGEFGSRRNLAAALQLLIKASEKSTGTCPEAPYTLGILLLNQYPSITIPTEIIQACGGTFAATTYLEYASEMGMSLAQYRLGYIYEQGLYGIRANITKAYTYYESASASNPYAMLALSRIHNQGIKVPPEQMDRQLAVFERDESRWCKNHVRNEAEAFKWCKLAAKQNIPEACYLLGWYYELGIGVPRDFSKAYIYYSKAIKKGNHKEAKERVDFLESLLKYQKIKAKEDKKASISQKAKKSKECHIM